MRYLSYIRESNRKLNDRFFPRERLRYVDCFRQLVACLSEDAKIMLHLGAGGVDLEPYLKGSASKPLLIALDKSQQALEKNPGSLKVCGDAQALPFPPDSMDAIVSEHVFEHFPRPQVCLCECFRVLNSGGKLVVSGPNGLSYLALAARFTPLSFHNLVRRVGRDSQEQLDDAFPTFYRFSTPREMRWLARKAGFNVVSIETFVGEPCYTTFLPLLHMAFVLYHLILEKLRPLFNFHIASVAVFEKPKIAK